LIELVRYSDKHITELVRILNQSEVIKWILMPPVPYLIEDAESYLGKCRNNLNSDIEYNFAVELNSKYIGGSVLRRTGDDMNCAFVGYHIGKEYWGKGYGALALRKLVKFGFEIMKLKKIKAFIFEDNIVSEKLLIKCGFIYNAEIKNKVYKGKTVYNLKYFSLEA